MQTFLPSGTAVMSELPGLMIHRAAFDRAIVERARCGNAEVLIGTALYDLDPEPQVAWLVDREDRYRTVHYRILVAADGPHSTVARRLGLPSLRMVQTRQYCVPLTGPYHATDIWLSDAFPGGYGWLFPKAGVANLGIGADRAFEQHLKRPLDALHARLVAERRVGSTIISRTGGAIPVAGLRRRLVQGRVLFVGDAGGFTHPISGAGIAAAVVSGEAAGRAAADFLAGDATALEGFQEDMRDRFDRGLQRAVERRRFLERCWGSRAAQEDRILRRGWIAFEEYYAD
jgi:flavin-dependent dehydrogenase